MSNVSWVRGFLLCFPALIAVCLPGQQRSGELRINAYDPGGAPLEVNGELIGIPAQTRRSFVTNSAGQALLDNVPFGRYRLTLSRGGFESAETTLAVNSPEPVELSFRLGLPPVETSVVVRILPDSLETVPGSTSEVTRADLLANPPFSIKEALRQAPGVHVVDEDAFGLNLNIGVRGLNPRRTQRTLLLEDGAPVHLAPYSDPSAHYHTPMELIESVEFIKGSGQIVHGPQTVGGLINVVTQAPPRTFRSSLGAVLGSRDFRAVNGRIGHGGNRGGLTAYFIHREGAGARAGHSHRIGNAGVRGLLRITPKQSLQLKGSYYEEDSRFSEAGVTQLRYEADPLGNPFHNDKFELQRFAAQAIHTVELDEALRLTTNVYYQNLSRTSYRQTDDATDQMTANPAMGCVGPARSDYDSFASLCGNKMRPRAYDFFGAEPRLSFRGKVFGMRNETLAGVRLHHEKVSRQRYNGLTPDAREDSPGVIFRDWNEIRVLAVPAYLQSTFSTGAWAFTPGVRLERISSQNRALRRDDAPVDARLDDTRTMVLPGFGATYFGLPRTTLFAGVHQGFAPPRPDESLNPTDPNFLPVRPERSTNYEAGIRSLPAIGFQVEASLFRIDFRDLIVPGAAAGLPHLTWANAGQTINEGFELGGRLDFGQLRRSTHNVYVSGAYTNLFTAGFAGDEFMEGINVRGNRLPYAPRHTLTPSIGYEHPTKLNFRMGLEHVAQQFSDNLNQIAPSPDGMSGAIPGFTTVNAAVNVPLRRGAALFVSGVNLADRRFIASRVFGVQVGRPRQIFGGLRWDF